MPEAIYPGFNNDAKIMFDGVTHLPQINPALGGSPGTEVSLSIDGYACQLFWEDTFEGNLVLKLIPFVGALILQPESLLSGSCKRSGLICLAEKQG